MASLGNALIYVRAVTDKLKGDLTSAESDVSGSASRMDKAISKITWANVGIAATAAAGVIAAAMTKAVAAAGEQEAAEERLAAVIRATGGAAGLSAQAMYDMAGGLQKVTTVGDETIISGMAILATFKNIKNEGFERATKAALDMSEVMQQDLNSAITMIAKALNDPIANLSAMSRAGVQFTKDQKEMIKVLWEAGDTVGAQNIILAELEAQFTGAAEAARKTFGGSVTAAKNAVGDLWEQVGFAITKNDRLIQLTQEFEKEIIKITPRIGAYVETLVDFFSVASNIVGLFPKWMSGGQGVKVAIEGLQEVHTDLKREGHLTYTGLIKDAEGYEGYIKQSAKNIEKAEEKTLDAQKDNWAVYGMYARKTTREIEAQHGLSWLTMSRDFERAMGVYQDSWQNFSVDPSDGIIKGFKQIEEQNAMSLLEMQKEWDTWGTGVVDKTIFGKDGLVQGFKDGYEKIKDYSVSMADATSDLITDIRGDISDTIGAMVEDLVDGTVSLDNVMTTLSDNMVNSLNKYATKMFDKVFDKILDLIIVNLGLGVAETGTSKGWAGAVPALAEMGIYLGAATAAILAAKTIKGSWADGGWIQNHPCGGPICEGSGVFDDVFLGSTPGVNHYAMGGEYVVNKRATEKYYPLLEKINRGYGEGGLADYKIKKHNWEPQADAMALMTLLAFGVGSAQGGPLYGIGYAVGSLLSVIGKAFLAKGVADTMANNFAEGGVINRYYYDGEGISDSRLTSGQYAAGQTGFGTTTTIPGSGPFSGGGFPGLGNFNPFDLGDISNLISDVVDYTLNPGKAWEDLKDYTEDQWDHFADCADELIDWDDLGKFLKKLVRKPLEQISKDLIDPNQFYPRGKGLLEDILLDAPAIIWEFVKDQLSNITDVAGCLLGFQTGTNYVPRDGAYYLHQGEAVVPASQNTGGGITFINKGIITTNDVDAWFAERMTRAQQNRRGPIYQPITNDRIGLAI